MVARWFEYLGNVEISLCFYIFHWKKGRKEGRKEGRKGGREGGRKGGREGGRKDGRDIKQ
jgi:hypothetical protein